MIVAVTTSTQKGRWLIKTSTRNALITHEKQKPITSIRIIRNNWDSLINPAIHYNALNDNIVLDRTRIELNTYMTKHMINDLRIMQVNSLLL